MTDIFAPYKAENNHVVDRLGALRELLRAGKAVEKELTAEVLALAKHGHRVNGTHYFATISEAKRQGPIDTIKIAAALEIDNLDEYRLAPTVTNTLKITERKAGK